MKDNHIVELAVALLFVAASMNAWPQSGQPASGPASVPGASAMTASGAAAPATGRKADRALRRKVYAAIGKQKEISAGDIGVTAKDGAITLYGSVTDASQIDKVVELAKGVPGVTSVTNELAVKKPLGGM
ncbi:BON domain-containing protein [Paraburkholderia hospita]|uniref:BON domain-containing protein n=1 Tax=Paraburkholderia hospita TaxID=169430 RepID=UPI000B344B30|nr:BON domain-containing protein [Paraburkholderia hospita]OUL68531.1 transporter [Paraburkholderia hospita]